MFMDRSSEKIPGSADDQPNEGASNYGWTNNVYNARFFDKDSDSSQKLVPAADLFCIWITGSGRIIMIIRILQFSYFITIITNIGYYCIYNYRLLLAAVTILIKETGIISIIMQEILRGIMISM